MKKDGFLTGLVLGGMLGLTFSLLMINVSKPGKRNRALRIRRKRRKRFRRSGKLLIRGKGPLKIRKKQLKRRRTMKKKPEIPKGRR